MHPRYLHVCDGHRFLGYHGITDLWYCPDKAGDHLLIARYSSGVADFSSYSVSSISLKEFNNWREEIFSRVREMELTGFYVP